MKRVEVIDEPLFVQDCDTVFSDQDEFRMWDNEFVTIGVPNNKWPEPATDASLELLNIHTEE